MATVTDSTRAPDGQPPPLKITDLPFVRDLDGPRPETGSPRHFWRPDAAGLDFMAGCALGQDHALQAVRLMAAERFAPLLGWVALDITSPRTAGEKGALVGFFGVFAHLAIAHAAGGVDRIERAFAEREATVLRLMVEAAEAEDADEEPADA